MCAAGSPTGDKARVISRGRETGGYGSTVLSRSGQFLAVLYLRSAAAVSCDTAPFHGCQPTTRRYADLCVCVCVCVCVCECVYICIYHIIL